MKSEVKYQEQQVRAWSAERPAGPVFIEGVNITYRTEETGEDVRTVTILYRRFTYA